MKPFNHKRKLLNHRLQHRQQIRLTDALHTGLYLPLAHAVHTGDVIDPFGAIEIALVDAVNAYPARPSVGPGCLAHANRVAHRSGLCEADPQLLVASGFTQVVQVRDRQSGQAFVAHITVLGVGAAQ